MHRSLRIASFAPFAWFFLLSLAFAEDALDGRSFSGLIGPAERPDLEDHLQFDDGYFWSDICTRCGFLPGPYTAVLSENGVRFSGTLESESRGKFQYDGIVHDDGTIEVSIHWERKRWYWTSKREIVFRGTEAHATVPSLIETRAKMTGSDSNQEPLCSRF